MGAISWRWGFSWRRREWRTTDATTTWALSKSTFSVARQLADTAVSAPLQSLTVARSDRVLSFAAELSSAAVPRAPAMGAPIVVTFDEPPPLGITWTMHRPDDSQQMHAIIESIHPGTAAATKPELRVGLHLCAVGGTQVAGDEAPPEGLSLQQVTDMLRHAARPVTLTLTEPPRAGRSSAILEDVPLVKKQTRASARDFRSAVDDMMQSAGISREEARAALEARGFLFDPYAQDAASPDNTLQLGAQTHSKRAAGGGGIAACCSTPAKSAAHGQVMVTWLLVGPIAGIKDTYWKPTQH